MEGSTGIIRRATVSPRHRRDDSIQSSHANPDCERRRLFGPRPRRSGEGLRGAWRPRHRGPRTERERHLQLAHARPAAERPHRGQRLSLHQRHTVRLRASGAHRRLAATPRPRRLGHQQRRQHGRRHALFGHCRRGDGRLPVRHPVDRLFASAEGLGRPGRGGARCPRRHRTGVAPAARTNAVAAQRQHPEPAGCRLAAARRDAPRPSPRSPRRHCGARPS